MDTILHIDLDNKTNATNMTYKINSSSKYLLFRVFENNYTKSMDDFERLKLSIKLSSDGSIYSKSTSEVVEINGTKLIKFNLDDDLLDSVDKLEVAPSIRFNNIRTKINKFKIFIYDDDSAELSGVISSIYNFNKMVDLWIDSIKKDQLNQPNGIISLDENGKLDYRLFQENLQKHALDKIIDTDIHGLILDEDFMMRYWDSDDYEWYIANSVNGGKFGYPHKPNEYNITGGKFTDTDFGEPISNGTF